MIKRTVYQCSHCKRFRKTPKIYFTVDRMYTHERSCFYNLDNRTCMTCEHNDPKFGLGIEATNKCRLDVEKQIDPDDYIPLRDIVKNCPCWEIRDDKRREDEDDV